jgi:hypothetical protein
LRIDGELVHKTYLRAGQYGHILGIYKGTTSVLPFKFQELELVGTFSVSSLDAYYPSFCYPIKTRTWKTLPSYLTWGSLSFEPFALGPYAQ